MHDMLNESPVYAEMTRLARERGLEMRLKQGIQQGIQEGKQEGLQAGLQIGQLQLARDMIIDVVFEKFPELTTLAEEKSADTSHVSILRRVAVKLSTVETMEEARRVLLQIPADKAAS